MRTTVTLTDSQADYVEDVRERIERVDSNASGVRWCVDFARENADRVDDLVARVDTLETQRDDLQTQRDEMAAQRDALLDTVEDLERTKRWQRQTIDRLQNEKEALIENRADTNALVEYVEASWWQRLKWRFGGGE